MMGGFTNLDGCLHNNSTEISCVIAVNGASVKNMGTSPGQGSQIS